MGGGLRGLSGELPVSALALAAVALVAKAGGAETCVVHCPLRACACARRVASHRPLA